MNSKTLTILLVATGATVVAAAVALRGSSSNAEASMEKAKLFPELAKVRNDVTAIRVQRASGGYMLRRVGDVWTLEDKGGYPVQMEQVRKAVLALSDATTVEAKTADPARHAKLGVEDFDAADSKSTLVTLSDKEGREVAKLVVGRELDSGGVQGNGQRYVRKSGEAQSWLAVLKLDLHEESTGWLAKEILKVPQDSVRSVEIRQPDGETVLVDRPAAETKDFTLHGIPEGKEATYPTVANSLATGLEYVNLEDVAPASEVDFSTGTGPIARFYTFDGLVVTVTTKDQDGKSYASFAASYEAPPQAATEAQTDPPKDGEAATPPPSAKKSAAEVTQEAAALDARLSKWAYVISSYSRSQLGKKLTELVKDKAPPPDVASPAGAAPEEGADSAGSDDDEKPMIIPGDLPQEIQDQIKAHQESIGNTTVIGEPRKKAEGDVPAPEEKPVDEGVPQPDSKPPQR